MNYRHAYHAGNHADVLKHVVLLAALDLLRRKPSPIFVLDTHAGRGSYQLAGHEARKSAEADAGIVRLASHPPADETLASYLMAVMAHNPSGRLLTYPGSPALIAQRLREQDRMVCRETQPEEAQALKALFDGNGQVSVQADDGYEALKALLPPRLGGQRFARGLVLVDPPFEAQDKEFDTALPAIAEGLRRWPQGVFVLWYPIKLRHSMARQVRRMAALPMASALRVELLVRPADSPLRMNGSGVLICNPPWGLEPALKKALPELRRLLGEQRADSVVEWIKPPA